ncbi:AMP-binding protein [Luteococcus sp. OSA5]|uniref:AMP-binding protein n=1 Tax=Luteococcus sp. OSA5 TaxID=3401630 RepID=UPI003B432635
MEGNFMHYRGPWADIEIPDLTLYELIFDSLRDDELNRVAFEHPETGLVVSFGELKQAVDSFATWLAARDLGRGDAVAVLLTNRPEYATAFHGTLRSGASVTPVNPAATAREIARQLESTRTRVVVTSTDLAAKACQAAQLAGLGEHAVVVVDGQGGDGTLAWREVLATQAAPPAVDLDPARDVACLPVSSGTSGLPKAVMLSHRNLVANMLQFDTALDSLGQENSLVAFLPFSHIYALTTNMNYGLLRRYPQYTMSGFDARLFLRIVQTRRPTMLFVVPPVASFLARSRAVDEVDWSSVKLVVSGAAPLDQEAGERLQQRMRTRVVQGYGMTELSPVTHLIPLERHDIPLGTIGMPIANVTMRVVDPETGQDVAAPQPGQWSQPGEMWISGPNAMLGYLHESEATDAVRDADGWVHTGDLVSIDHEGTTRVVDRIKELIKRRGFQVAPAEVEALLVQHPGVVDAAVLGVEHHDGDQIPHALLILREGTDRQSTPAQVVQWINEQVAQYKHLGGATAVDALPRSAAGKILRRELPSLLHTR